MGTYEDEKDTVLLGHSPFICSNRILPIKHNSPPMKKVCILGGTIFNLEKAMATHSSTLAWKIPGMEEPGRLQSMGSLRVGQFKQQFHF